MLEIARRSEYHREESRADFGGEKKRERGGGRKTLLWEIVER